MDLALCLKKMELVGVLAFATVDDEGAPQIRNISAIHYEPDALYFFTARGKNFCKELMEDGRVQILCYTRYKEMIRMSAKAYAVADEEQGKWSSLIFPMYIREIPEILELFFVLTERRLSILILALIQYIERLLFLEMLKLQRKVFL